MSLSTTTADNHPLIRHLASVAVLSEDEKQALLTLPMQIVELSKDQEIVREGDRPGRSCLILEGVACTFKMTGDGKRQILAFNIAGDVPDLLSLHLKVLDCSLGTVTSCRVAFIQHAAIRDLCERYHGIASALWRMTLIDAAIFREWMMNIGQRSAFRRVAHLLCETLVRMKAVGLARDYTCETGLTQRELADATGITGVHLNRTLQQLRSDGLISLKGGTLQVLNWQALTIAGDFDPAYLHLKDPSLEPV